MLPAAQPETREGAASRASVAAGQLSCSVGRCQGFHYNCLGPDLHGAPVIRD